MHTLLSPDYLRITNWGVSVLQRGVGQREALFPSLLSTKSVCGEVSWWQLNAPNLYTSASHCFTYLLKRLIHAFIPVAKWFTAHTHTHTHTHTERHTHATQTHLDPKQGLRGLNTITFSSLLEGRKNSGATRRLLCPCGKTHGRLSQRSLGRGRTRAQLLNRKSPPARPCAASSPPHCLAGSWLREESQNWHWYNKVLRKLPVCSDCVCKSERGGETVDGEAYRNKERE